MKIKTHLVMLALLGLSFITHAAEKPQSNFTIQYNSSELTIITVESNKLECTWHTSRKDLNETLADLESFDKHKSSISLTEGEIEDLLQWTHEAIKTKVTDDQEKSRRGYSTVLSVTFDGKTYRPNHNTIKALMKIVSEVIKDRRKEEF